MIGTEIPSAFREQNEILEIIGRLAASRETPVHLVGGAVRDLLLERDSSDIDVALETTPEGFRRIAGDLAATPGFSLVVRHDRFGTATFGTPFGKRLDLATARRERYPAPASLPEVETGATIVDDLSRRDFTVHAMARQIGSTGHLGEIVDLHGGQDDIARRTLRLLHADSLADDPTRAIRAARYESRLGFRLDGSFSRHLETARAKGSFQTISADRMRRALEELLREPAYPDAVATLIRLGIFDDLVMEWGSTIPPKTALAAIPGGAPLVEKWIALLASAPATLKRSIADRLNFPRNLRRATESSR